MDSIKHYCIFLALILFSATLALAQDGNVIEVSTRIVNISVEVTNEKGQRVSGLTKEDFLLYDNKKQAGIAFLSTIDAPTSYGIVYDLHPTTDEELRSVLLSLEAFTDSLADNEDFFLTLFNEYGSLNVNFVPTAEQISRHLSFGDRNEPNSLYDAVYFAGQKLQKRTNQKKTLIIISDGKDHQSHHSFSELERLLSSSSVQIYAVILDKGNIWDYSELGTERRPARLRIDESMLDKSALRKLSRNSGGAISESQVQNSVELFRIFAEITREMRGRYSLGFYPYGRGYHKIQLKLKGESRQKYNLNYRKSFRVERIRKQ